MLEHLRPPTDNLYKFLALAGLAVFILGLYLTLTSTTELEKYRTLAEDADYRRYTYQQRYDEGVERIDAAFRAGRIDAAKATEQKKSLYQRTIGAASKYTKAVEEADASFDRIDAELRARYQVLQAMMWIGGGVSVVGFCLWYVKLQRPLDIMMGLDLQDRQDKSKTPP
jgi:hypothetical protein